MTTGQSQGHPAQTPSLIPAPISTLIPTLSQNPNPNPNPSPSPSPSIRHPNVEAAVDPGAARTNEAEAETEAETEPQAEVKTGVQAEADAEVLIGALPSLLAEQGRRKKYKKKKTKSKTTKSKMCRCWTSKTGRS